ncbi:gamma-glutamyl-gamma-aminobutyrate hydrolase family protein [Aerococcus viridans]|nr:gamma-glutamyl-gamma-aminobutyrate hydrolase family protein [Aerococcus viridans]
MIGMNLCVIIVPHGYSKSLTMAGHMPIIIPLQEDLALAEQYVAIWMA